jgi:hypothetical protein
MAPTISQVAADATAALPQFDGFPYLNTRLVPALYHITPLPADAPQETLLKLARRQVQANCLDICLLLDARRAVYFSPDGRVTASSDTPRGGTLVANGLVLPVDLLHTNELRLRQSRLDRIVADGRRKGTYVLGDLSKGGRRASVDELERLRGAGPNGAPRGLERCRECGDWHGECLDTSQEFTGMIIPVHCLCENHNRCARCGVRLYSRRLNANFYNVDDGVIYHVPGFCGLEHKCTASGSLAVI